jgi:signal transduction histidine kinase
MLMTSDQKIANDYTLLNSLSPTLLALIQDVMRSAVRALHEPEVSLTLLDGAGAALVTTCAESAVLRSGGTSLGTFAERVVRILRQDSKTKSYPHDGIMVSDTSRDPRFKRIELAVAGSLLCVPLITQAQPVGILVAHSSQADVFHEQHLRTLAFVAEQIALVIRMSQQAEKEAMEVRTKMLSTVTHELRSPVNTINGYLDLALSGAAGELNAAQREFIQRARVGSETLFALLEDALFIARTDAGQLRLSREEVSLSEVIMDAVEEMELTAQDHGITVNVELDEDLPELIADASRLQQVVRNLLSNALQFTAAGGMVTIVARADSVDKGVVAASRCIKLQVIDTGCGIAPAFHQRIFERFFQVPDSFRQGRKGQGLGLTAVKMIVELHGGTISVESEPGQGSKFLCTLPVS